MLIPLTLPWHESWIPSPGECQRTMCYKIVSGYLPPSCTSMSNGSSCSTHGRYKGLLVNARRWLAISPMVTTSICSKSFYTFTKLVLYRILECFEHFKRLILLFHQIEISISTIIICKGNKLLAASSGSKTYWPTYIAVYKA